MGLLIWPLLAALGIIGHFRLAALGRSSSERVNVFTANLNLKLETLAGTCKRRLKTSPMVKT